MQFFGRAAAAAVMMLALTGCDSGGFITNTELPEATVRVSANVASSAVTIVALEVTGPGISTPIVANLPVSNGAAAGQVTVLAGSGRVFTLRAFDAQGYETHRGAETVNVASGNTTQLNVALSPLVGDVSVSGAIGGFTITLTPATSTVTAGQTIQLQATVRDAQGATVSGAQVVWGSTNPAVATVSSSGLLTARVAGTTTIGASYRGFSGTAAITVN
jgi:hypothetical protein